MVLQSPDPFVLESLRLRRTSWILSWLVWALPVGAPFDLRDIGLLSGEIRPEATKPFWMN
jgi:hypothetical protein